MPGRGKVMSIGVSTVRRVWEVIRESEWAKGGAVLARTEKR